MEKFSQQVDEEYYLNWSGLKEEMDLSSIYDRYRHLFDMSLVEDLRTRREQMSGEEARRLRYLYAALATEYMKDKVKGYTDEKESMEAKKTIEVEGEKIPFRFATVKLVNEDDRTRRKEIWDAKNKVIEEINVVLEKRIDELHRQAKSLGYTNYTNMFRDTKKLDFESLMDAVNRFNVQTKSLYEDNMTELLSKIGVSLEEAEKHDVAYLLRAKDYDKFFKKERTVDTLKRTLKHMGFVLEEQKNIHIDVEEREKKSPRAFCAPIVVPDRIMLVTMPTGGVSDYQSLFHEAGHAEHHAWTERDLAMEYKYLGDVSVSETYAFTLEYLTADRNWLKRNISMEDIDPYIHFSYLVKMFFVRRYGAKLRYELSLHTKGRKGMDEVYSKTLEDALTYRHPPSHYLSDLDDGFYCAQYLRAWIFESQLKEKLREEYGDEWFMKPEAGNFLKGLWEYGQKYDVVELAKKSGFSRLDIEPLLLDIRENMGG